MQGSGQLRGLQEQQDGKHIHFSASVDQPRGLALIWSIYHLFGCRDPEETGSYQYQKTNYSSELISLSFTFQPSEISLAVCQPAV